MPEPDIFRLEVRLDRGEIRLVYLERMLCLMEVRDEIRGKRGVKRVCPTLPLSSGTRKNAPTDEVSLKPGVVVFAAVA